MSAEPWQVHEFSEPVIHRSDDGVHRVEWQHRGRTLATVVADEIVEQFASMATELWRLRSIEADRDDLLAWIGRLKPRPAYESTLCPICGQPITRYWQEGAPHLPGCPWLRATQEAKP